MKDIKMIEETLELLNRFLSEDDGVVVAIEIKDFEFLIEIFYTSKHYLPNQLVILKSRNSINHVFNICSFNEALSNIAYDTDYDSFYVFEPNSLYEGFGLLNDERKIINNLVIILNFINQKEDYNLEIINILS